jgi:D-alanyl-D-alanine carboxypeptidase/D-alanyl-D-alanine-endopeptidase (penicillin-binding protein 4)
MMLGGLLAGAALPALAEAPLRSPRPPQRGVPGDAPLLRATTLDIVARPAAELIAEADLGGEVSYVVVDAETGLVLEERAAAKPMPPASTLKSITSLYALERLGDRFVFPTRLIATGPVANGMVQGDLVLAGGGDPTLTTDDLGDMAAALKARGVTGITGRFLVWGGALPYLRAIDEGQPDYLGYNPAVSGLNLNYNRVNCEWRRVKGGYEIGLDARAERFVPKVSVARVTIAEREMPVFAYADSDGAERWSVARAALGRGGSRWLPVRRPDSYAGDVFRTLAQAQGIRLPAAQSAASAMPGQVLVTHDSSALLRVLKDMMAFSTNLTAEAVGMAASARAGVGGDHRASAAAMADWLAKRAGVTDAVLHDHSGLGAATRISAAGMVQAIRALGPKAGLRGLMKPYVFKGETGRKGAIPALVEAKTGTLNFVSALTGFMVAADGRELVFAIFTGDVARRDAVPPELREAPAGGAAWTKRSKRLQQRLIERWGAVYGA